MKLTRREAIGLAAAAMLKGQTAGSIPSWKTELRELAPDVFAYVQGGGPGIPNLSVSNAGVIAGPAHMMAIDSLGAPLHAKAFIAAAKRAVPGKPFDRLALTHHHIDHIAGNRYFLPAEIVGHSYCREAMLATKIATPLWEKRDGWADGTEERKLYPPVTTFNDMVTYRYGDLAVELIFNGPAHTWGDVMVYIPRHKILFAGDIAFFYVAPFCQNAHVTKWLGAIDRIMAMDVDVIVPGHGPLGGKKELKEMADYLRLFKAQARQRFDAGMSAGKAAADISLGHFDEWIGAPEKLVMNTVRLYREFDGTIQPDVDDAGMRAATKEFNAIRSSQK